MQLSWIVLAVFLLVYVVVCISSTHRAKIVWIGIALLLAARWLLPGQDPDNILALRTIFDRAVNWNILGILSGAMFIADLLVESRVPAKLAAWITGRLRQPYLVLLSICALSGCISAIIDNVTTVLIVSPLALAVARSSKASPVPLLVGVAICSNLEGAATMIGDPPSMLMAANLKLTFNDFFVYLGKPSIFFNMQLGMLAGLVVLYFIFRRQAHGSFHVQTETVRTWIPAIFVGIMICFLICASVLDPGFRWLAGTGMITLGLITLVWHWRKDRPVTVQMLKRYDVPTILFLAGIFIFAHALEGFGWVKVLAQLIAGASGNNQFAAFLIIVWGSALISAFVDNIPYVAATLPVTHSFAALVGAEPFLYAAGLLLGACLGGNITPIGASCNIVAVGLLRREGYKVSFGDFARIGLPFTLAATAVGSGLLWLIWH